MQVIVSPTFLKGTVTAPASKSAMQRACAAALLKRGKTVLHNPGVSNDDEAALDIMGKAHALLAEISESADTDTKPTKP